jgi:hypothetical protein
MTIILYSRKGEDTQSTSERVYEGAMATIKIKLQSSQYVTLSETVDINLIVSIMAWIV